MSAVGPFFSPHYEDGEDPGHPSDEFINLGRAVMAVFYRTSIRGEPQQMLMCDVFFSLPPEESLPNIELVRDGANRLRVALRADASWVDFYPNGEETWLNLRFVTCATYYPTVRSAADSDGDPHAYPHLDLWVREQEIPAITGDDARRVYEAMKGFETP